MSEVVKCERNHSYFKSLKRWKLSNKLSEACRLSSILQPGPELKSSLKAGDYFCSYYAYMLNIPPYSYKLELYSQPRV